MKLLRATAVLACALVPFAVLAQEDTPQPPPKKGKPEIRKFADITKQSDHVEEIRFKDIVYPVADDLTEKERKEIDAIAIGLKVSGEVKEVTVWVLDGHIYSMELGAVKSGIALLPAKLQELIKGAKADVDQVDVK